MNLILLLEIAGGVVLLISIYLLLFVITKKVPAKIQSFYWNRKITIEKLDWVSETSSTGFPSESRNQSTSTRIIMVNHFMGMDTTRVNGRTHTNPRYQLMPQTHIDYNYEIQRWQECRSVETEGNDTNNIDWPTFTLQGLEREGERQERYEITFISPPNGKERSAFFTESEWLAMKDRDYCTLAVTLLGKVKKILPTT